MMSRNFGVTSGATVGDNQPRRSHGGKLNAPHNLILFPHAVRAPLKSSEIREAVFNIASVFFVLLFLTATGLGLAFSLFVLLFVRLG